MSIEALVAFVGVIPLLVKEFRKYNFCSGDDDIEV